MKTRPGFSLAEVVLAITIVAIIGGGMTKVLLNQNRFFDQQTNMRVARGIARNSMNILLSDLRMAQDSGSVDSASADGKAMRVLVPYRYGLVCGTSGNLTTVSLLPVDSGTIATAVYNGFAYRNTTGTYTYIYPGSPLGSDKPVSSLTPATCTGSGAGQAQINSVSMNGRTGDIVDVSSSPPSGATAATPVFLFQRVTYAFRASNIYPGQIGLWRNVQGAKEEEIMAPFDTSSGFAYYQTGDDTPETTVPPVGKIRGVDIILSALSPRAVSNGKASSSKMVTSVFFKNVRAY